VPKDVKAFKKVVISCHKSVQKGKVSKKCQKSFEKGL